MYESRFVVFFYFFMRQNAKISFTKMVTDHQVANRYDAFLCEFWGVSSIDSTARRDDPARARSTWTRLCRQCVKSRDMTDDEVISLAQLLVEALEDHLPGVGQVTGAEAAPLASVQRLYQKWTESLRTRQEDCDEVVDLVFQRWQQRRLSETRTPPRWSTTVDQVHQHSSSAPPSGGQSDDSLRQEVVMLARMHQESQRQLAEHHQMFVEQQRRQQRRMEEYEDQIFEMKRSVEMARRGPEIEEEEPDDASSPDMIDVWADDMVGRMQDNQMFVPPPPPARPPLVPTSSLRRPSQMLPETAPPRSIRRSCQLTERALVEPRQWSAFHDPVLLRDKLESHFTKSVTGQPRQEMFALLRLLPAVVDSVLEASEDPGPQSQVFEQVCNVADHLILEFTRKKVFCLAGKKGLDEFEHGLAMVEADLPTATKMAHAVCARLSSFQEPARTGAPGSTGENRTAATEPRKNQGPPRPEVQPVRTETRQAPKATPAATKEAAAPSAAGAKKQPAKRN